MDKRQALGSFKGVTHLFDISQVASSFFFFFGNVHDDGLEYHSFSKNVLVLIGFAVFPCFYEKSPSPELNLVFHSYDTSDS